MMKQATLLLMFGLLLERITNMARTLDETLALVKARNTKQDSILELLKGLKLQLKDALAAAGKFTPEQQAAIDQIFDLETADAKEIDEALVANVPPAGGGGPNPI